VGRPDKKQSGNFISGNVLKSLIQTALYADYTKKIKNPGGNLNEENQNNLDAFSYAFMRSLSHLLLSSDQHSRLPSYLCGRRRKDSDVESRIKRDRLYRFNRRKRNVDDQNDLFSRRPDGNKDLLDKGQSRKSQNAF
jgi:hypothetical protein